MWITLCAIDSGESSTKFDPFSCTAVTPSVPARTLPKEKHTHNKQMHFTLKLRKTCRSYKVYNTTLVILL